MCSIDLLPDYQFRICRICMINQNNLIDIFSISSDSLAISAMVMDCAPVQVTINDKLPKRICNACLVRLENSYRFRVLCIGSDVTLRRLLSPLDSQIKAEHIDIDKSFIKEEIEDITDDIEKYTDDNVEIKLEHDLKHPETSSKESKQRRSKLKGQVKINTSGDSQESLHNLHKRAPRLRKSGPRKEKILPDTDGIFRCKICSNQYKLKSSLVEHQMVHSEFRFRCEVCDKGFTRKMLLKTHEKVHTDERTHSCEFCGKTFRTASALRTHQRIHLQIRPYKCEICMRSFIQNKSLKNHMRTHTGERPFVCETCGRSFNRKHILKTHTMTHTGERPFKCDLCNQGFICKQHLILHKSKHSVETTLNFKCS